MTARHGLHRLALCALTLVAACSDPEPKYASIRLTHEAPDAMLTGVAGGPRAAADLIVGCVGFLGDDAPDHVITVVEAMKLEVVARSPRGPISLAVVGPDGAACDDDTGTGHAPRLSLLAPGRYEVWVAARQSADVRLPYELSITKNDKSRVRLGAPASGSDEVAGGGAASGSTVSVTVTSEPSGAEVRTAGGQVLGTTPAMFVYPATAAELAAPLGFLVAMRGQTATRVEGRAQSGELVLHATLASGPGPGLPGETIQSAVPQRIRDFTSVTQGADYAGDCTIQDVSVTVDVRHTCPSDLRVTLRSPTGDTVTLHNHASRRLAPRTFALSDSRTALSRFVGQSARGHWEVVVRDDVDADVGSFESFSIRFTCGPGGRTTLLAPTTPAPTTPAPTPLAPTTLAARPRSLDLGGRGGSSGVLNPWAVARAQARPSALAQPPRSYPPPPPPYIPRPRTARDYETLDPDPFD